MDHLPPGIPRGANPEEFVDIHDFAVKVVAEINKHPQTLTPLARAAVDAHAVLYESLDQIGGTLQDFNEITKAGLETIRQTRFAFVAEAAQIMAPLKEVRQFFIGPNYEQEVQRLKEFVDLCERLEALKRRGTLDALADTILKLAE